MSLGCHLLHSPCELRRNSASWRSVTAAAIATSGYRWQLQPGCWHGGFDSLGLLRNRVNICQQLSQQLNMSSLKGATDVLNSMQDSSHLQNTFSRLLRLLQFTEKKERQCMTSLHFFRFCFCQSRSSSRDVKRGCRTEAQGQVPPPLSPPGEKGASRCQSVPFNSGTGLGLRSNWPLQSELDGQRLWRVDTSAALICTSFCSIQILL